MRDPVGSSINAPDPITGDRKGPVHRKRVRVDFNV